MSFVKNGLYVFKLSWKRCKGKIPKYVLESKKEQIKILNIYVDAQNKNIGSRTKWEVDHIIPLEHKLVCGLHCSENLQIISKAKNKAKSNKFQIIHLSKKCV